MEPEQNQTEQPTSKFENLNKITPLSKYLAMVLFITLPFLGAWIGYQVATSHSGDNPNPTSVVRTGQNSATTTSSSVNSDSGETSTAMECPADVTVMSPEAGLALDNPDLFAYRAAFFFDRVSLEMIDDALGTTPAGEVLRVDELFSSQDSRWRLTRPMSLVDDPDALVMAPPQSQYLIKPTPDAPYDALVLVGLPEDGNITHPATAGLLTSDDGYFFTVEPTNPETCQIDPSLAKDWVALALQEQSAIERKQLSDSPTTPSNSEIFRLEIQSYGGCQMLGNCSSYVVMEDGQYIYTPATTDGNPTEQTGQLPSRLFSELQATVKSTDLAGQSQAADNQHCDSYTDGIDLNVEITTETGTYELDTCHTAIDLQSELFSVLEPVGQHIVDANANQN